jgi:hypothetical protein
MAELTRGKKPHSDLVGLARLAQGRVALAQGDRIKAALWLQQAVQDLTFTIGANHRDTRAAEALLASVSTRPI